MNARSKVAAPQYTKRWAQKANATAVAYQGTNWELKKFVNRLAIASASTMLTPSSRDVPLDDSVATTKKLVA